MTAFHGDADVRRAILAGLEAAIASQAFMPDADADLSGRVSAILAVVGERDVERFEAKTGYPGSLGLLLDEIVAGLAFAERAQARTLAVAWFAAVQPDDDLTPWVARIAIWLLDEGQALDLGDPDTALVIADVRALHDRSSRGDRPQRAEWSAARNVALVLADRLDAGPAREIAELAAGLSWPAERSRTVLIENLRLLANLKARQAVERSGWTQVRSSDCAAEMQRIWQDMAAAGKDPTPFEFRQHFEKFRPDLAVPFALALDLQNRTYKEAILAAGPVTLALAKTFDKN